MANRIKYDFVEKLISKTEDDSIKWVYYERFAIDSIDFFIKYNVISENPDTLEKLKKEMIYAEIETCLVYEKKGFLLYLIKSERSSYYLLLIRNDESKALILNLERSYLKKLFELAEKKNLADNENDEYYKFMKEFIGLNKN